MTEDTGDDADDDRQSGAHGPTDDLPPDADGPVDGAKSGGDPFDAFDVGAERRGDPFDHLDDDAPEDRNDRHSDPIADAASAEPDEPPTDPEPGGGDDGDDDAARHVEVSVGAGDPFGDVDVSSGDPFEAGGTFDEAGVEGVDPDEVWDRLTGEADPTEPIAEDQDRDRDQDQDQDEAEDDVVDVSKHAFCETCEFFSPPPEVSCTHPGTDILEFVDVETVRVANCPIVAERRELGGLDED